jgi:hypothetical protein
VLDRLLDCVRSLTQFLHELRCLFGLSEYLSDLFDRTKDAFEIVRICDGGSNVLVVKLLSARIELVLKRTANKKVPPTSIFLRQGKQASAGLV